MLPILSIRKNWLSRLLAMASLSLLVCQSPAIAVDWSTALAITCGTGNPIRTMTISPFAVDNEVQIYSAALTDQDRYYSNGKYTYVGDSFCAMGCYSWNVLHSDMTSSGIWKDGISIGGSAWPSVYWTPTEVSNDLTIWFTANDIAEMQPGDTGTRDDPARTWTKAIRTGAMFINNLSGNVAGSNISGTGLSVMANIDNMHYSVNNGVSVSLGTSDLATGTSHVYAYDHAATGYTTVATDANGDWPAGGTTQQKICFDSTHLLSDGTTGTLRIKVAPSGSTEYYSIPISDITIYNKAYVLGNDLSTSVGADAASLVGVYARDMKHNSNCTISDYKSFILSNIPTYTVFYMYSHGSWNLAEYPNETVLWDCYGGPGDWNITDHAIPSSLIATAVGNKSSSQPAYNFVHIDSCYSAGYDGVQHTDMASAFGITSSSTNRAFLGFIGTSLDTLDNYNWVAEVWSSLQAGQTINQAVNDANTLIGSNYVVEKVGQASIIGDPSTTLHKVYK